MSVTGLLSCFGSPRPRRCGRHAADAAIGLTSAGYIILKNFLTEAELKPIEDIYMCVEVEHRLQRPMKATRLSTLRNSVANAVTIPRSM